MSQQSQPKSRPQASYGDRVIAKRNGTGEYLLMQAPVKDVVSFSGSFINIPDFGGGQELVRDLTLSMLDKGTGKHSKQELAQVLEGMGALITFSADGIRARVSGRSMSGDIPTVLSLVAEQLFNPSFPEDEFELLKGRFEAALQRSMSDTASLAEAALSRRIYGPDHPFYTSDPATDLETLAGISLDQVCEYYETQFHVGDWKLALVGDTDYRWFDDLVASEFKSDRIGSADVAVPAWSEVKNAPGTDRIAVQDRENINVNMGHALRMSPADPEYLSLYLGNYILGGNFSARLMNVIRDEMGLTYGIHSSLSELDLHHYGCWKIAVTLSQNAVERGISEVKKVISRFVSDGVTDEEVEEKKETVAGLFQVGLSSTRSLASALLRNSEKQRDPSYLDQFPKIIGQLNTSDVNAHIQQFLHPDHLHVAMAGSIEEAQD